MENQSSEEIMRKQNDNMFTADVSDKSWVTALVLAFFLGVFGVHRFYLGYDKTGWVMLICTLIGFLLVIPLIFTACWSFIDFARIVIGSMKDPYGYALAK